MLVAEAKDLPGAADAKAWMLDAFAWFVDHALYGLPAGQVAVWIILLRLTDADGAATTNATSIAAAAGGTERDAAAALDDLEAAGLVRSAGIDRWQLITTTRPTHVTAPQAYIPWTPPQCVGIQNGL